MSYRNPEQVVDTQSGQYIRQMQQSVASSFENYQIRYQLKTKKELERTR